MKKFLVLLGLISFVFIDSFAQQLQRIEIEAKVKSDNYSVVPAGEHGVLVFSESDDKVKMSEGKSRVWVVTKYSTDFKEDWSDEIYVEKNADLSKYIYQDGYLYLLFSEEVNKNNDIHVFKLNVKDGTSDEVRGTVPYMQINDFIANKDKLFIAGNTQPTPGQVSSAFMYTMMCCYIPSLFGSLNFEFYPALYMVDFERSALNQIELQSDYRGSIKDIQYSEEAGKYYSIMLEQSKKKIFSTKLSTYDNQGNIEKESMIKSSNNNILVNGKVAAATSDEKFLLGSFSKPKNNNKGKKDKWGKVESVEGFFFTKFSNGKQEYIKYYEFSDLKSYRALVNDKENKSNYFNNNIDISNLMLVHNIIEKDGEFIILGEVYYPEYHTEYYYDNNGKRQSKRVFDGYRYTHAIVAGFDQKGNLLWDHSFRIMEILTMNLTERVKVMFEDDNLILVYANNGYIQSKIVQGEQMVDGKRSVQLDTEFSSDEVKANYKSEIQYWYDNYFLASGYQKIVSDKNESGKGRRKVFYFNKVGYK